LDKAVQIFKKKTTDISILQCTTAYPTTPPQWGLHIINILKYRYNIPVGFSDHSGDIFACMAASALGAEILEFHVVFDKRMFGPDAKASLEIDEVVRLVQGVKQIRNSLEVSISKDEQADAFTDVKRLFGKSLCVNKDLPAGHTITFNDLDAKKPAGFGIAPSEYPHIVGKKLRTQLKQWEFLHLEDIHPYDKKEKALCGNHCQAQL
jgi:N-acetylneuraminate synthase